MPCVSVLFPCICHFLPWAACVLKFLVQLEDGYEDDYEAEPVETGS